MAAVKAHPAIVTRLPVKAAPAADLLYKTRQARLEVQRVVEALEKQENALKAFLIETLPKGEASGITGAVARVAVYTETVPAVEDWAALYAYVKKSGAFELFQRRVNDAAVKERWDAGKAVPGVGTFTKVKVSCTKKGEKG